MTLWGSATPGPLGGITGNPSLAAPPVGVPSTLWVPGFDPRRLQSNPLIDVQAIAAAPGVGSGQYGIDRPIGPYLVTLSPVTVPTGEPAGMLSSVDGTAWRRLCARIKIGRGGAIAEAWVDWPFSGGTFVVACDTLSLSAMALNPNPALVTEPLIWDVRCGAWATPTSTAHAGGTLTPRYTMALTTSGSMASPGTSGEVMIPPFARRYHFQWQNNIFVGAPIVEFLYREYGTTFSADYLVQTATPRGGVQEVGVPLDVPSRATTMVVNNLSGGALAITNPELVFELDLGA